MWPELYWNPKRCHLKWNRLDYQLLFKKEARASGPAEIELKIGKERTLLLVITISSSTP